MFQLCCPINTCTSGHPANTLYQLQLETQNIMTIDACYVTLWVSLLTILVKLLEKHIYIYLSSRKNNGLSLKKNPPHAGALLTAVHNWHKLLEYGQSINYVQSSLISKRHLKVPHSILMSKLNLDPHLHVLQVISCRNRTQYMVSWPSLWSQCNNGRTQIMLSLIHEGYMYLSWKSRKSQKRGYKN